MTKNEKTIARGCLEVGLILGIVIGVLFMKIISSGFVWWLL